MMFLVRWAAGSGRVQGWKRLFSPKDRFLILRQRKKNRQVSMTSRLRAFRRTPPSLFGGRPKPGFLSQRFFASGVGHRLNAPQGGHW